MISALGWTHQRISLRKLAAQVYLALHILKYIAGGPESRTRRLCRFWNLRPRRGQFLFSRRRRHRHEIVHETACSGKGCNYPGRRIHRAFDRWTPCGRPLLLVSPSTTCDFRTEKCLAAHWEWRGYPLGSNRRRYLRGWASQPTSESTRHEPMGSASIYGAGHYDVEPRTTRHCRQQERSMAYPGENILSTNIQMRTALGSTMSAVELPTAA